MKNQSVDLIVANIEKPNKFLNKLVPLTKNDKTPTSLNFTKYKFLSREDSGRVHLTV